MTVVMDTKMKVFPKKRQELLRALDTIKARIPEGAGLLGFSLSQDKDDENLLFLTLEWQSQESLDQYLASSQHGIFLGALQVLCESPEISFTTRHDLAFSPKGGDESSGQTA